MTRWRRPRTLRRTITRVEKVCIWTPDKDLAQCVVGRSRGAGRSPQRPDSRRGRRAREVRGRPGVHPRLSRARRRRVRRVSGHRRASARKQPRASSRSTASSSSFRRASSARTASARCSSRSSRRLRTDAPLFDDVDADALEGRDDGIRSRSPKNLATRDWRRGSPAQVVGLYSFFMKLRYCLILAGVLLDRRDSCAEAGGHRTPPAPRCTRCSIANGSGSSRRIRCGRPTSATAAGTIAGRTSAPTALAARQAHRESVLKELAAIPRDQLSPADRLNYDLFRHQYQMTVEGFQHRQHLIRTSTLDGVQGTEFIVDSLRFQTVKDFDDWLARLDAFPAYMDQNIALMREGMKTNVLLPKIIAERVRPQIAQLATQPPEQSGYYRPFRNIPASLPAADRERLAKAGARSRPHRACSRRSRSCSSSWIASTLPASYDGVGWWRTSSGLAGYRYFARYHTTTDLAPQEIHALGLKEVARIRAEMEAIKKQVGFTGHARAVLHAPADRSEVLLQDRRRAARRLSRRRQAHRSRADQDQPQAAAHAVRRHPDSRRDRADVADGVRQRRRARRVAAGVLLRQPLQARDAPEVGNDGADAARSDAGALPADFDGAGARRPAELPPPCVLHGVRRRMGALRRIARRRHGLYKDDPYSKFGQLTYEMWRAVRLVVDTGIHAMEWERERAIKYFMDNAAKTENDVTTEIDRYISVPGQALAYKIGELKIKELRASIGKGARREIRSPRLQRRRAAVGSAAARTSSKTRVNEWLSARVESRRLTGTTLKADSGTLCPAVVSTMYSPGASGARVISTRRHRVPSASSRIVAVTGTFSGEPVRPSSRAEMSPPSDAGVSTIKPFRAAEPQIGRGNFARAEAPEEQRAGAERVGLEREDERLGRAERSHALRANQHFVVARLERRRRRDRDLRRERARLERRAPLRDRLAFARSAAWHPPVRPCSNRRRSPCCAALRQRRARSPCVRVHAAAACTRSGSSRENADSGDSALPSILASARLDRLVAVVGFAALDAPSRRNIQLAPEP